MYTFFSKVKKQNMSDHISEQVKESINKRVRINYELEEQLVMIENALILKSQFRLLKLTNKVNIFDNQEIIASMVVAKFKNRKCINIMVIALTQSGKTGSMCATIKQYMEDSGNLMSTDNIYIITGLSSCEWKEQTKERMPASIQSRVYHRCELPETFVNEIKNKTNVLIIMDEIQVAAKKGQTIYNTFEKAGLLDKSYLYENDIKIVEYTATPDGTVYDLMKWNDASDKIIAEPGEGYTSSYDLYEKKRVKQYKDLCGYNKETDEVNHSVYDNIKEIQEDINNYNKSVYKPLYHIIRTKTGLAHKKTIENFKKIFDVDSYNFINYDRTSDIVDINNVLIKKPEKHTFIFIKEMLRCAKTLKKEFLGVLYDRYNKFPDDAGVIQGLVGRDTGYDNNGISITYTNVESIEKYHKLWLKEFNDNTINWKSKTTKYTNGILSGRNTFNNPDYFGFSDSESDSDSDSDSSEPEPIIKKFSSQEEAKSFYVNNLKATMKGRGPNKVKPNCNGYYEATIRSKKGIYTCDEIFTERRQGLSENKFRFYPCYKDINDKSSLEWHLVYYA